MPASATSASGVARSVEPTPGRRGGVPASGRADGRSWLSWLVLLGVCVASAIVLIVAGRRLTFFFDDWLWIIHRPDPSAASLLEAYNNHPYIVPIGVYQLFFRAVGLDSQEPYRLVVIGAHVSVCVLLFAYLRGRVGDFVATAGVVVIAFFGVSAEILLWPNLLGWVITVASGLAALTLIDQRRAITDAAACACLILAVASSAVGAPIALGVAVELACRRSSWRRLWIAVFPLMLFGLWVLVYGGDQPDRASAPEMLEFVGDLAAGTIGALVGVGTGVGSVVVTLLVAVLLMVRWRALRDRINPRVVAVVVILASYWVLTASGRAGFGPPASRYYYVGAAFLLVLMAELFRGATFRPTTLTVIALVAALSLVWNLAELADGADRLRRYSEVALVRIGALDLVGTTADPDYLPDSLLPDVAAGSWRETARRFGSPGYDASELVDRPLNSRRKADATLVGGLGIELSGSTAPSNGPPPTPSAVVGATTTVTDECLLLQAQEQDARVTFEATRLAVRVAATATDEVAVWLASFAPEALLPLGSISAGTSRVVELPAIDGATWVLEVRTRGTATVCSLTT